MNDNYKIIEYKDTYREKVKTFLVNVAVNEFGFNEWNNYFTEANFLNLNLDKENFWIALNENNDIIATIGIMQDINENTAKLHSLYVRKDYRKKGIATILCNYCEKFAKEKGYESIILHTYTKFEEAMKFYKKIGYKQDTTIKSKDGIWYSKNIHLDSNLFIWKDYFANIRNKYNMRVSTKNPLIINLDGKGTTNNLYFSLIDSTSSGSFLDIMEKTVKHFTAKYNCISIFGTDEVSFIFEDPMILINDINKKGNKKTDEIISMFSQYFYEYFNELNKKENIFWHGECFSIPNTKINSYIKYKSGTIKNVLSTYFLKKNGVKNAGKIKLSTKLEECAKYEFYNDTLKPVENGILYLNGNRINLESYLEGKIEIIEKLSKCENNNTFLDLTSWN